VDTELFSVEGYRNAVAYDLGVAGLAVEAKKVLFFPSRSVAFDYITGFGRRRFRFEPETFLPGLGERNARKVVYSLLEGEWDGGERGDVVLLDLPFRVPGSPLPFRKPPASLLITYPFVEPLVVLVDVEGDFGEWVLERTGYVESPNPLGGHYLSLWALNPTPLGKYRFSPTDFDDLRRMALEEKRVAYPLSLFGFNRVEAVYFCPRS
jgi:hypothetical protein